MALTITLVKGSESISGRIREAFYDVTFDSSYPTGGEAILPKEFGLANIFGIQKAGGNSASGGYSLNLDTAANKLMVFLSAGFTPAGTIAKPTFTVTKGAILASSELGLSADANTATVNNNTIAATLTLLAANSPVGAPAFTGTAVAAAADAEVANATDLSTLTFRVRVTGN